MIVTDELREAVTSARVLIERWVDDTRQLNTIFMSAWRGGYLDEAWAEFRKDFPSHYLTYYIRARGMGDIKIGKSNQVKTRLKTIFTYCSRGADLIACYPADIKHETEVQEEFKHLRLCGEWFRPGDELITHLRLIGCDVDGFTNVVPAHFARQFPEAM